MEHLLFITKIKSYFTKALFAAFVMVLMHTPLLYADSDTIAPGSVLTVESSVETAIKHHPELLTYYYAIKAKEAQAGQARAGFFPRLDFTYSYTRTQLLHDFPAVSQKVYNNSDFYTALGVTQTIYDFGKINTNLEISNLKLEASNFDYISKLNSITYDVKKAYFDVLKALKSYDVDNETVTQFTQHLEQAKDFYKAGTKSRYDVTKAEVDLSNAKLTLLKGENALKQAWVSLNNAMGIYSASEYKLTDALYVPFDITLEEAMERAMKNRPDLKSLISLRDAAKKSIKYAKTDYYPTVSGSASYMFDGSNYPVDNGWSAGIILSWNIFKGLETKQKVAEAAADLDSADSKINALKLDIQSAIQKAYLDLKLAKESIANAKIQLQQALENLEIVKLRYESGLSGPVELTDAIVTSQNANLTYINAQYDYKIAVAAIEKTMGR
ncbi:MAG: TolC family protein [Nitrospirae bacterium]|nr:TolC family protein [Nitrospirota bacterium]MBF0535351.1 TolC family protein [Nitrospirota bacterium]MBF0616871.1 TolC family protein [Nitrospirota bacterium]